MPKTLRRFGWLLVAFALLAGVAIMARFTWRILMKYPPADATEAWTMVGGIGGMLTGIGTCALAVLAFRGLYSLRLSRIDMEARAERERKLSAIARIEEVATEIVPMNTPILEAMAAAKLQPFLKASETVQFNPDPTDLKSAGVWVTACPAQIYAQITTFLNRLESWSVYFTEGVADERIAFEPIAALLRSWVGQYYAVLLVVRAPRSGARPRPGGTFPNLVKLFTLWSARMDAAQLARMHDDVVAQLDRKQSQLAQAQLPKAGPKFDA